MPSITLRTSVAIAASKRATSRPFDDQGVTKRWLQQSNPCWRTHDALAITPARRNWIADILVVSPSRMLIIGKHFLFILSAMKSYPQEHHTPLKS
jgi:hypothetical protein